MDYAELLAVAQTLIADTGRLITVEKLVAEPQDTAKPWRGTGPDGPVPEASVDVFATFVPASGSGMGSLVSDEELLKSVEQVCLIAGDEEQLDTYTTIIDGTDRFKIKWTQVLKPGDTVMLYVMGVAR